MVQSQRCRAGSSLRALYREAHRSLNRQLAQDLLVSYLQATGGVVVKVMMDDEVVVVVVLLLNDRSRDDIHYTTSAPSLYLKILFIGNYKR